MTSISCIVCTRNRPDDLSRLWDSIDGQTLIPDEIVIVDSSDNSRTKELSEKRTDSRRPYTVKYLQSKPGLTLQRNIGVEHSRGEHLYFFDDDIILDPSFMSHIENVFAAPAGQDIGGVCGKIISAPASLRGWERYFRKIFCLPVEGNGRLLLSHIPTGCTAEKPLRVGILPGGLTAYTRNVFSKHHFDERLSGYAYMEDADFSYRVGREYALFYEPRALVEHRATTFKRANSRKLRRMFVQNQSYLHHKNLPQDVRHRFAFYRSIIGMLIFNLAVLKDVRAFCGICEGFWFGHVLQKGPYNAAL